MTETLSPNALGAIAIFAAGFVWLAIVAHHTAKEAPTWPSLAAAAIVGAVGVAMMASFSFAAGAWAIGCIAAVILGAITGAESRRRADRPRAGQQPRVASGSQ